MPLQNECGCVLEEADHEEYRRDNCAGEVDGKCLDHIYGIDGGDSVLHSLRYRFSEGWTNDSGRSHCNSRDGRFEPGQEEEMEDERERKKFITAPLISKSADGDGALIPRYRFTSDKMDEVGDIITREATEEAVEGWRQWRNIRLQHDPSKPIGKAIRIGTEDGLEWNEMDVRVADPDVIPLIEGEDPVLGAASVGIIVNEFEINTEDEEAQERAAPLDPWIITDYDLVEISLVDHPANYEAVRVEDDDEERSRVVMRILDYESVEGKRKDIEPVIEKAAGADTGLPLADRDREWDARAADGRVRSWAGGPDPEDIDWGKYADAFFWYDDDEPELFGSYKLPFADVINGTLTAIPRGIFAAAQRFDMTDIPSGERDNVAGDINAYYERMAEEFDDDEIESPLKAEEPEEIKSQDELLNRNYEAIVGLGEVIGEKLDKMIELMAPVEDEEEVEPEETMDFTADATDSVDMREYPSNGTLGWAEVKKDIGEQADDIEESSEAAEGTVVVEEKQFPTVEEIAEKVEELILIRTKQVDSPDERVEQPVEEVGISEDDVRKIVAEEIAEYKKLKPRKSDALIEENIEKDIDEEEEDLNPQRRLRHAVEGMLKGRIR